jgi:O-antigen/teichoic acid export membrane protein
MRPESDEKHRERRGELVYTPDPLDEQELTPPNAEPHRVKRLPGAEEIKRNTLEALIFRAASTPLAFGLVILQGHALHKEGVGKYALATLSVLLFARVLQDLGNAATREMGDAEDRVGPVAALALRLGLLLAPLGIIGAVLLMQTPELFGQKRSLDFQLAVLAAVALAPNIVRQTVSGILVGMSRVRLWSYLQIAPTVLAFVGFFVFVEGFHLGVTGAILAWTLGHTVTAVAGLIATRSVWLPHVTARLPKGTAARLMKIALAMGAVNVIIFLNYRIEFALLEHYKGADHVGVYRIATQIAESLWIITTAIATGSWATVLHDREDRAVSVVLRASVKGLLFVGAGAVAIGLLAGSVVPLVFSDEFKDSVSPTLWLLPGIVAYAPVAVLSIFISVRHRLPNLALIGPALSIVVTIGLALMLIPSRGVDGAAIASSGGYIVSAVASWILFVRLAGLGWLGRRLPSPA